jgi:hypothetical protein
LASIGKKSVAGIGRFGQSQVYKDTKSRFWLQHISKTSNLCKARNSSRIVLWKMGRAGIALVAKLYLTNPELKHVYRPCLAIIVQSHVWYQDEDYYST